MPSIGNIVVKRISQHRLLPPVYQPIVKHAVQQVITELQRIHHALPSLIGAGGESPKPHKEVFKFITQNVTVGAGTVNRVKVSGVVGISYTQTSFTFTSYTIAGIAVTKSLTDTTTITQPLIVQRRKTRTLFEDSPQQTDLSATLTIKRTKVRAIAQTSIIGETLTGLLSTARRKTLTETRSISESLAKIKASKRSKVETVSESGDVIATLPGVSRALSESISILENLQGEVTHAGGINITKSLSDTTSLSEAAITRRTALRRILAQSIALADAVVKVILTRRSYSRSFTQLSYSSLARAEKALSESVAESHTVRMTLTKKRSVPVQTVTISEQLTRIVTGARPADIVPVSEEVERTVGRSKPLGDSVTISDTLISSRQDVVTVSDQVVRVVSRNRGLSQSVSIIG